MILVASEKENEEKKILYTLFTQCQRGKLSLKLFSFSFLSHFHHYHHHHHHCQLFSYFFPFLRVLCLKQDNAYYMYLHRLLLVCLTQQIYSYSLVVKLEFFLVFKFLDDICMHLDTFISLRYFLVYYMEFSRNLKHV